MNRFKDRIQAGQILSEALQAYKREKNTLILALPRGGVPVAYEIAKALSLPLDVLIVRKLGAPGYEELAMGALASGGKIVLNTELMQRVNVPKSVMDAIIQKETNELNRREKTYRHHRPSPQIKNQNIIIVDDGIATGATMQAAVEVIRQQNPKKIIIAAPVAAQDSYQRLQEKVEEIVCPLIPMQFDAVGQWYENFTQTTDAEVCDLLQKAHDLS